MRFHSFDGSGYFQFRCRQKDKSVKVDGISVDEFMNANFQEYLSCTVLSADESKKKPRLRISAKLTGGASKASKVFHQFDWIYHRPVIYPIKLMKYLACFRSSTCKLCAYS